MDLNSVFGGNGPALLGLNIGHVNPSASLVIGGILVAHVEEERFVRVKNAYYHFPANAIKYCLDYSGLKIDQIEAVCLGFDYDAFTSIVPSYLLSEWKKYPNKDQQALDWELNYLKVNHPNYVKNLISDNFLKMGFKKIPPLHWYEHHYCHALTAFYSSHLRDSLILTADGIGEWGAFVIWEADRKKGIQKRIEKALPHSLGWVYRAFTVWAGFKAWEGEGKLMGLAPYGRKTKKYQKLSEKVIKWKGRSDFLIDPEYLYVGERSESISYTDKLVAKFGKSRKPNEPIEQRHKDVAYAIQDRLEKTLIRIVRSELKKTGKRTLSLAGGLALNCKSNGSMWNRMVKMDLLDDFFVYPISSDDGIGIGACMAFQKEKRLPMNGFRLNSVYLGPEFSDKEVEKTFKSFRIRESFHDKKQYLSIRRSLELPELTVAELKKIIKGGTRKKLIDKKVSDLLVSRKYSNNIEEDVSQLLTKNKVVAWFQGRMEAGPRSLGNRSILASPIHPKNADKVNKTVKFREPWRPFCPSVLKEHANEYFENIVNSPYMIIAFLTKKEMIARIPSVVHVDGSVRIQMVDKKDNPRFYRLIKCFADKTGEPILLNTSLNIKGEPICCTPEDAVNLFFATDIDALAIGNYLIEK